MEEKNKKNVQEIDKKGEFRRLVLDYIGEKDIKRLDDFKSQKIKEPEFSKIEQIRAVPVKKSEAENKIEKEDIDNARKVILNHQKGDNIVSVKKDVIQSVGAEIKKKEVENKNRRKWKKSGKEKERKKISQEKKNNKKCSVQAEDRKIKFKKKNFCVTKTIALIAILLVLFFMILILMY